MEYSIVGSSYYVINNKKEIKRKDGEPSGLIIKDGKVSISIYGYVKEVELEWLYWLSYFRLDMPSGYEERVFDYEFKDIFSLDHMRVDPKMVLFKKPVYLKENNNYRLIARFPKYAISTTGSVYSLTMDRYYKSNIVGSEYLYINMIDQARLYKRKSQATHRLVAMTWVANDDYDKYYLVDHIDGDKTNCHYTNLRWTDHRGNNLARSYQGLNAQAIAVRVRDIDTGEVNEFPSLKEAARYMERAPIDTVTTPLRKDRIFTTKKGRYEIKSSGDTSPWYYENKDLARSHNQKMRIEITKPDGTILVANNSDEFIKIAFDGKRAANSSHALIKLYKKKYPDDKISLFILNNYNNKDITYIAKNIVTDETITATDRKTLMDKTGVTKSSIRKSISNNGAYVFNNWAFKLDNHLPFKEPLNLNNANKPTSIVVHNVVSNESVTYDSLRAAGVALDVDRKTILNALDTKKLLFNTYFIRTWSM